MSFSVFPLLESSFDELVATRLKTTLEVEGLVQVIDVAMLSDSNIEYLAAEAGVSASLLFPLRAMAVQFRDGFGISTARAAAAEVRANTPSSSSSGCQGFVPTAKTPPQPYVSPTCKSSSRALVACMSAATRRWAFPKSILPGKRTRTHPPATKTTLEQREAELMAKAKFNINAVFLEYASLSPRFVALRGASELEWEMQRDCYRGRSRSHLAVSRRVPLIRSFFLDMQSYGWQWNTVSPLQIAAWVRGRVSGGASSAAARAKLTLDIVEKSTDVNLHSTHPLVKGQLCNTTSGLNPNRKPKNLT